MSITLETPSTTETEVWLVMNTVAEGEMEKLRKVIEGLDPELKKVLKYFIRHRSVGELIAIRELRGFYGVKDPAKSIGRLVDLGLVERGVGCYNISRKVVRMLNLSEEGGK